MKTTAPHTRLFAGLFLAVALVAAAVMIPLFLLSSPSGSQTIVDEDELEGRAPTPLELSPAVEAAFLAESYKPSATARLVLFNRASGVKVQVFRVGAETAPTVGKITMKGVPVTKPKWVGAVRKGSVVQVHVGDWPSGVYFARLDASDGRVGFAPFVVAPARFGVHRVAVVEPTLTWQAYNIRDDDGDGKGDSWYARWACKTVRLGRPYLNRGVPFNFRRYDLPFLHWLNDNRLQVDVLADADLERAATGDVLAKAYDLIVFPGHHEYVTTHEYDVVERYRDLGGNLAFLSANNFFWRVIRHGNTIEKTKQWRDLDRAESALIGVQYRGNDSGESRGPWIVRDDDSAKWLFAGTELREGMTFGNGGIEVDKTAHESPKGLHVLAEIPDLFGPGFTAQMTYYETDEGARVFAAGAFTMAGQTTNPVISRMLANLWTRLALEEQR